MALINTEIGYKFIRDRILSGTYPPGMRLLTRDLAKEIGISRTPLRDALRQLEADGLVTVRTRLGAAVKSMDLQEFKDLCGVRQSLETYAAGLAAANRTESELAEMHRALEAMRTITNKMVKAGNDMDDLDDMKLEDVRFHHAIATASKNDLLKKEIIRLHLVNRVVLVAPTSFKVPFDFRGLAIRRKALKDHQRIYDAIAERNIRAAKEAMEYSLQDIIDYSIQLKVSEEQSEFQSDLGLVRRSK